MQFKVADVAPREGFFQALTLFGKSNRLCYELTRIDEVEPEPPAGEILPAHVYGVVEAALAQLIFVKEKLGIRRRHRPTYSAPSSRRADRREDN